MPGLTIGDDLPNLQVETNHGKMKLHDYLVINHYFPKIIALVYLGPSVVNMNLMYLYFAAEG